MTDAPNALSEKEQRIIACALKLLKENGDAGLTLRQVAECAEMRLSNVQYYFSSRNEILKAMASMYFDACTEELRSLAYDMRDHSMRERARMLIKSGLIHGTELSDMCRIFRELWALSSRNAVIHSHLMAYYETLSALLADIVLGEGGSTRGKDQVATLLVPFIEGYSITAPALPMPFEQVVDMLTDLTLSVVDERSER